MIGERDVMLYVLDLPAHPASVGVARHVVRDVGRDLDAARLERAEIVVSEIVSNAVLHGSRSWHDRVHLELATRDERMTGCVSDHGRRFERDPGPPEPGERVGGFGLHIVQALAEAWSVDHTRGGNSVSFVV